MPGLSLNCGPCLQQRFELKLALEEPGPEDAARGLTGLKTAHDILAARSLPGLLVGGLARKCWLSPSRSGLASRKDVDVAVLRHEPENFPSRFEGGIDWWLPAEDGVLTNGNDAELIFTVKARPALKPGLYVPSRAAILIWRRAEHRAFAGERSIRDAYPPKLRLMPLLHEYPVCPDSLLIKGFAPRSRWRVF